MTDGTIKSNFAYENVDVFTNILTQGQCLSVRWTSRFLGYIILQKPYLYNVSSKMAPLGIFKVV